MSDIQVTFIYYWSSVEKKWEKNHRKTKKSRSVESQGIRRGCLQQATCVYFIYYTDISEWRQEGGWGRPGIIVFVKKKEEGKSRARGRKRERARKEARERESKREKGKGRA